MYTFLVCGLFTLEIFHLSLKHSLLFNKFSSFNVKIESIYDSPNDVSDNGLYQVSGKTSLLIHNINLTGHKNVHIAYCSDMSHRSVLALEIQGFS